MEVLFSEKLMSRILYQAYNKPVFVVFGAMGLHSLLKAMNLLAVEPREPNFKYIFLN